MAAGGMWYCSAGAKTLMHSVSYGVLQSEVPGQSVTGVLCNTQVAGCFYKV
jgi:hypothetical protein